MISRAVDFGKRKNFRFLSTLVATEEFPMNFSLSPKVSSPPNYTTNTLSNGIKLASKGFDSKITSFKFAVNAGSSYEGLSEKGASHLIATAAYSNTKKTSSIRLVRDLENIGAVFSSSADREKITYSLSVPTENAEKGFETVSQFFVLGPSHPYLIDEAKEIAAITYSSHFSNPMSVLSELVHEAAYGEGSPYGSSLYSTNLDRLDAKDVMGYRSAHFKSGSTVITSSGVDPKLVYSWSEKAFQNLATGSNKTLSTAYTGGDVKLKAETDGISYVALGFPVPSGESAKSYEVLVNLLSQRLNVQTFYLSYSHGGLFGIYTSAPASEANKQIQTAVEELKKIATSANGIDSVKNQLSLSKYFSLEGENATCALLDSVSKGSSISQYHKYSDVTTSSVGNAASKSLLSTPSYAVLGTTMGTFSFDKVCSLFK